MTDLSSQATIEAATDRRTPIEAALDDVAGALRRLVESGATGELAALKRLDPQASHSLALVKLTLLPKVEALLIGIDDAGMRRDLILRLAIISRAMAIGARDLRAGGKLGWALSKVGCSEQRLGALLTARGPAFLDAVSRTAARLAREGPLPFRQLGVLALAETLDPQAAEAMRFEIARDYARSEFQAGRIEP